MMASWLERFMDSRPNSVILPQVASLSPRPGACGARLSFDMPVKQGSQSAENIFT